MHYCYMLRCSDESIYVGNTFDLEKRLNEHNRGTYSGYTRTRRPVRLIWNEAFPDEDQAFVVERQIKNWSRAKKLALAYGEFKLLSSLAKKKSWEAYKEARA